MCERLISSRKLFFLKTISSMAASWLCRQSRIRRKVLSARIASLRVCTRLWLMSRISRCSSPLKMAPGSAARSLRDRSSSRSCGVAANTSAGRVRRPLPDSTNSSSVELLNTWEGG